METPLGKPSTSRASLRARGVPIGGHSGTLAQANNPDRLEHRSWRANSVSEPLDKRRTVSLVHVPSLSRCCGRRSRARLERDCSLAGGGQDEQGGCHPQADRGSQEEPSPAAQKKLAVLVLMSQNGGAPAGVVVTASKPRTVFVNNRGLYRVKAEIDSSCKGNCDASYRLSGSANHKLEIVPSCQPRGSGFVCSKVKIVKVY